MEINEIMFFIGLFLLCIAWVIGIIEIFIKIKDKRHGKKLPSIIYRLSTLIKYIREGHTNEKQIYLLNKEYESIQKELFPSNLYCGDRVKYRQGLTFIYVGQHPKNGDLSICMIGQDDKLSTLPTDDLKKI